MHSITIISATNRVDSNTEKVANYYKSALKSKGVDVECRGEEADVAEGEDQQEQHQARADEADQGWADGGSASHQLPNR